MKRRLPILACVMALCALINCGPSSVCEQTTASQQQLVRLPPEVRLRKLHLVRPDLIQYPICFEVYC
jgi:hypothetical protein